MKFNIVMSILALTIASQAHCSLSEKLSSASQKITSVKNNIKMGKLTSKCSSCKGGGGGGNGCSRCNKA